MTPRGVQLTSKHVQQPAVYSISSQSESGPLLPRFSGDIKPGKFEVSDKLSNSPKGQGIVSSSWNWEV